MSWFDTAEKAVAPRWHLKRLRARKAAELLLRHYDAASVGRRTQGWRKSVSDGAAATFGAIEPVRGAARDLVRNNPYAASALNIVTDHVIGAGVSPSVENQLWMQWAGTTDCDADGRHDLNGLMRLALRCIAESGEVLIRQRLRRVSDGFAIPMQLQVIEPDYLDSERLEYGTAPGENRIIQGVEFDLLGKRAAYWLFSDHPGATSNPTRISSRRVPSEGVIHAFDTLRTGQVRGMSWFAPLLLRFNDFADYEDAMLMKQKIAACLSVITSDATGDGRALGVGEDGSGIDSLEPGMILNVPPGREIDVVTPPQNTDYQSFAPAQLRAIASGLGLAYEDLTRDYQQLPFSAARMSRLSHYKRVKSWRDDIMRHQLLDPIWLWFQETARGMSTRVNSEVMETTTWNFPPMEMIEPDKEGLATMRNVRTGIQSYREVVQERGKNYDNHLAEMEKCFTELRKKGIILDIDPLFMTQNGQRQSTTTVEDPEPEPPPQAPMPTEEEEEEARAMLLNLERERHGIQTNGSGR